LQKVLNYYGLIPLELVLPTGMTYGQIMGVMSPDKKASDRYFIYRLGRILDYLDLQYERSEIERHFSDADLLWEFVDELRSMATIKLGPEKRDEIAMVIRNIMDLCAVKSRHIQDYGVHVTHFNSVMRIHQNKRISSLLFLDRVTKIMDVIDKYIMPRRRMELRVYGAIEVWTMVDSYKRQNQ
jgi:hypothetical protein